MLDSLKEKLKMTSTTKYIIIGIVAIVGIFLIYKYVK